MLRTKIVCTLGPATSSREAIDALVQGGMDVARLNLSHGDHESHRELIRNVREAARERARPVAILADLQGPRIRVGSLEEPVELRDGEEVVFAPEGEEGPGELPTTYAQLSEDVKEGDRLLLDDGTLELECTGVDGRRSRFRVLRGGLLKSYKGMNVPTTHLKAPSVTEKDYRDLDFLLEEGVEFVGLSFIRTAQDVRTVKEKVRGKALVVAKVEMARALEVIEEILAETDAVMVARGDLGVELPFERVPMAQKQIIQLANFYGRPVITATQMLESMIEHARPTRAEASDVANAILDGTDAVMLSGETAVGKYPVRALEALVRISREIESSGALDSGPRYLTQAPEGARAGASPREHAVAGATVTATRKLGAPAILVITRSGFSARLVSSYRPSVPIFAVCTDPRTYRQLTAVWGVWPLLSLQEEVSYDSLSEFGRRQILEAGQGEAGDPIVITAGFPFHQPGTTNTMRVEDL